MDIKVIKDFWIVLKRRMEWFDAQARANGWSGEFSTQSPATPDDMDGSGLNPDSLPDEMVILVMACSKGVVFQFKKQERIIGAPEAVWDLNYLQFCNQVSESFNIVGSYVDGDAALVPLTSQPVKLSPCLHLHGDDLVCYDLNQPGRIVYTGHDVQDENGHEIAKSYLYLLDAWSRIGFPNLDDYIRSSWAGTKFNLTQFDPTQHQASLGFKLTPEFMKPFNF